MRSDKTRICSYNRAFTLIELLVVIAVIALLLAILVPGLKKAKQLVARIACQSNLRQVATAWVLYLDDNKGAFYQGTNANHDFGGWRGMAGFALSRPLNPYLSLPLEIKNPRDKSVFRCPDDSGGVLGAIALQKAYNYFGNSYQTNLFLAGPMKIPIGDPAFDPLHTEINARLPNLNRSSVDSLPARLVLLGDSNWLQQWDSSLPPGKDWHHKAEYYNLAFLDTHVEFLNVPKCSYVTGDYTLVPFKELNGLAVKIQQQLAQDDSEGE